MTAVIEHGGAAALADPTTYPTRTNPTAVNPRPISTRTERPRYRRARVVGHRTSAGWARASAVKTIIRLQKLTKLDRQPQAEFKNHFGNNSAVCCSSALPHRKISRYLRSRGQTLLGSSVDLFD